MIQLIQRFATLAVTLELLAVAGLLFISRHKLVEIPLFPGNASTVFSGSTPNGTELR